MTPTAVSSAQKTLICGVDEAGRGALAGPVVAAACILPKGRIPVLINDSKKMTEVQREASYEWIVAHCVHGVGMVEASEIDDIGILAATECAMQIAVSQVAKEHRDLYLLVDGRDAFWFDHPHSSIVRGDETEACIAAASILAKVTRDRHMTALSLELKSYGFAGHKGYGTPEHINALRNTGASSQHRRTFIRRFTQEIE